MASRVDARALIAAVLDAGSWVSWDEPPADPISPDRVLAAQHAWLSPLPPEGAAAVLHGSTGRAPEVADAQGVSAAALRRAGIVDGVIAERPDAADEPAAFLHRVSATLAHELAQLRARDSRERSRDRPARYRNLTP